MAYQSRIPHKCLKVQYLCGFSIYLVFAVLQRFTIKYNMKCCQTVVKIQRAYDTNKGRISPPYFHPYIPDLSFTTSCFKSLSESPSSPCSLPTIIPLPTSF